jgi:2-hydroxychromene-2-carboxylate isomerase
VPARFYFGAMSPYSWFAAERIGTLLPDAVWRPVFAGGLFRAAGRTSWGLTDDRAWKLADCEQRAREHGLGEIVWPDPWPTVDVVAARAMVVADHAGALQPFALALMRLAFKEGHDLGDPASAAEAARRTGLDAGELVEAAQSQEIKDEVRTRTAEATALGIIGVPTVIVGDELYWGDDRLEDAAARRTDARGEPAAC